MAWLSVGTTNEDLCDKMVDHAVLEAGIIQDAFRNTDRGDFIPEKYRCAFNLTGFCLCH
jgi:hypothetical protein